MSQATHRTAQHPSAVTPRPRPGPVLAAGAISLVAVVTAAVSLTRDGLFAPVDSAPARAVLSAADVTVAFLGLGVVGLLAGVTALARPQRGGIRVLSAVAVLEVLAAGLGLQSISTIALAGYLLAMALPLGLLALSVQAIRHYPRGRWLVLALLAMAALWGAQTGALRPSTVGDLAVKLAGGFGHNAGSLLIAVLVAAFTGCWAVLALRLLGPTRSARRLGDWCQTHRRGLTVLAALGPLPYALLRATWATPWPLLSPDPSQLDPGTRLWGLLLGGAALLGAILTIGLIRPWSATFPRWFPWWAGRGVPVPVATVPGGVVAGVLCLSALPMLLLIFRPEPGSVFTDGSLLEKLGLAMVFPFWFWGPALALALWGYARSRRDGQRASSTAA